MTNLLIAAIPDEFLASNLFSYKPIFLFHFHVRVQTKIIRLKESPFLYSKRGPARLWHTGFTSSRISDNGTTFARERQEQNLECQEKTLIEKGFNCWTRFVVVMFYPRVQTGPLLTST